MKGEISEASLLEVNLPLPPLSEQQMIVSAWERSQSEIASIRRRIAELEEKIEVDFLADLGLSKPKRAILPKVFSVKWKDFERWSIDCNLHKDYV